MREPGQRVILRFPHDNNFGRQGKLVRLVDTVKHPESWQKDYTEIWEILLEATDTRPEILVTYNVFWLHLGEMLQLIPQET